MLIECIKVSKIVTVVTLILINNYSYSNEKSNDRKEKNART